MTKMTAYSVAKRRPHIAAGVSPQKTNPENKIREAATAIESRHG